MKREVIPFHSMSARKEKNADLIRPKRLRFPEDERKNEWLGILLDAYYLGDKCVFEGISKRIKRGEQLACKKGCSSCCSTHSTIPAYPLEIIGIYWYTDTKIKGETRVRLAQNLISYNQLNQCPFLIDGACSIHPMRPLACRFFNVFNSPCAPGEDPFYSRRKDVLTPNEQEKQKALSKYLHFHGIRGKKAVKTALKTDILNNYVKNLREIDWKNLGIRLNLRLI